MEQIKTAKSDVSNSKFASTIPVRVKQETKQKIDDLLERINKKDLGRKVRSDELILLSLSLVGNEHIKQLKEKSFSNADRFEQAYRRYLAKNKGATKDYFLGLLMAGKVDTQSHLRSV